MSVLSLRIGYCQPGENRPGPHMAFGRWGQEMWLGNDDWAQAVVKSITHPFDGAAVLNIVSRNEGSRWDLDPLWSSSATEIVHHGADRWRAEKLREIARHEVVRDHLRVCWENRARDANCSRCEKCVRTMLTLAQAGVLEEFRVFDRSRPLAERVEGLGSLAPILHPVYTAFLEPPIDAHTSRAIRRLLATEGTVYTSAVGALFRIDEHWRITGSVNYTPLHVRRPPDRNRENDSSLNLRFAVEYVFTGLGGE